MPSPAQYRALISKLRDADQTLAKAQDERARLSLGLWALQAVILYLCKDTEVLDNLLTRPLGIIENALHDAGRGARVALLAHSPLQPGKPSRTTRESVQGALAFALELLTIGAKMGTEQAAKWIADEARKLGVFAEDGSPIAAKRVRAWRTDINRKKGSPDACETFEGLRRLNIHIPLLQTAPFPQKREHCQHRAIAIVKSLAAVMPRSGPKPNRLR